MRTAQGSRAGLLLALLSGCLMAALAWGQSLHIIDLKHRTAQEVIPVLQPLVEPGGALSGQDYKLFVRASASNVTQLRQALAQIDKAPRQLMVSVKRATRAEMARAGVSASGTVAGERGGVSVNQPPSSRSNVTVRATDDSAASSSNSVSSVQVLEGGSAFIATGSSIPIVTSVAGGVGRHWAWAGAITSYRDLASGFMVTPRVNGEVVVLDIEQRDERVQSGQISTQRLATQVSARLGEWMQLGGVAESASSQNRGVLNRTQQTASDERSIWVKVEAQ